MKENTMFLNTLGHIKYQRKEYSERENFFLILMSKENFTNKIAQES